MTARKPATPFELCGDRICPQRWVCLRWVAPDPRAGRGRRITSLFPIGRIPPEAPCPYYLSPDAPA